MMDIEELKKKQQTERTKEHKARLRRQSKRKAVIIVYLGFIALLTPLFLHIGKKIELKTMSSIKEHEMTPDISSIPSGGIAIPEEIAIQEQEDAEKLRAEASDIEGLSKYDKIQMGLSIYDNSDSDCDGLIDKEEIEE